MPTKRVFIASLVIAFVMLSVLIDNGATQRVVIGTVGEFEPGEWMSVANDSTRVRLALRETTVYDGNTAAIKPGVRVTVWYRSVAERRPVADKVRVLPDTATR
jgi:hypothetical protein